MSSKSERKTPTGPVIPIPVSAKKVQAKVLTQRKAALLKAGAVFLPRGGVILPAKKRHHHSGKKVAA